MKGKYLVIGLIVFVIAVVVAIYFAMMATFNNYQPQPVKKIEKSFGTVIESTENVTYK